MGTASEAAPQESDQKSPQPLRLLRVHTGKMMLMPQSLSSLKAKIRQAEAQQRRAIAEHNRNVAKFNRAARDYNEAVRRLGQP